MRILVPSCPFRLGATIAGKSSWIGAGLGVGTLYLLALALSCSSVLLAVQTPDELLRQALDRLAADKTSEALELITRFKQDHPRDARGFYVAGLVLAKAERYGEAVAEFDEALRLDPENLEYHIKAALAQRELKRPDQAIQRLAILDGENLEQARSPEALWLLADLYFEENRHSDAERVLHRFLQLKPSDLSALLRLGQIDLIEGHFEAALEKFQNARSKKPEAAPIQHAVGLAQWRLEEFDPAQESLRKAVSLAPDNASFHLDLARLLLEKKHLPEALDELKTAQSLEPENADVAFQLARAYRESGDVDSATRQMSKFQTLQGDVAKNEAVSRRTDSRIGKVTDLLAAGKVQQAHQILLEIVQEDPEYAVAHNYLAKIYISSGRWDSAQKELDELKRLQPDSFDVPFLTASFYYRRREPDKALGPALKARDLRPDYADLRNLLGNIYFELGNLELARQEYQAAVKLAPDRKEFELNLRSVSKPEE